MTTVPVVLAAHNHTCLKQNENDDTVYSSINTDNNNAGKDTETEDKHGKGVPQQLRQKSSSSCRKSHSTGNSSASSCDEDYSQQRQQ